MQRPFALTGWLLWGVLAAALWASSATAGDVRAPLGGSTPMPHSDAASVLGRQIIVQLTVDAEGRVVDVELETPLGVPWDERLAAALRRWTFRPATLDGVPHSARIRVVAWFEPDLAPDHKAEPAAPPSPVPSAAPPPLAVHELTQPGEVTEGEPIEVVVQGRRPAMTSGRIQRDAALLSAAPHPSGSDLLSTLPGMFLTQHSGEGKAHQIFYRGFDAVHGQDVEIDVAGAPVNEVSNVHGQGYADLHFVIPEVVQQLEVLPGPFEPEQGGFAVAGSVRYRLGFAKPGLTLLGGVGSFGARRALAVFHPEDRPASDFAAVELHDTQGFGARRAARRISSLVQHTTRLAPGLRLRTMGGLYAGAFESAGVLRLDDLRAGRIDRFGSYTQDQGGHSARAQLVSALTFEDDEQSIHFTPYLVFRDLKLSYNFTGYQNDPVFGDQTTQRNRAATAGFTLGYLRRVPLMSRHDELRAGVSLRRDAIEQTQVTGSNRESLVDADVQALDLGAWLGLGTYPLAHAAVRAGVRADGLWFATWDRKAVARRAASGVNVGPKLVVDVGLLDDWHLQLAAASGFRSPQARSLGDGERTPFTTVKALELGTRYATDQGFSAGASAFANWLDDDLVFDETSSRNVAAPSSLRSGISLDVTARTGQLLSSCSGTATSAVFTGSDSRFVAGEAVPYIPRLVARCDASLGFEVGRIGRRSLFTRFGFGQQLVWQRPLPYGEIASGSNLVDASLSLSWRDYVLRLDATNLLGAEYFDGQFVYASRFDDVNTSALPERHVTVGAPRSVLLSFTINNLLEPSPG